MRIRNHELDGRAVTMQESLLAQVLPFIEVAISYIAASFGVAETAAADLVHMVLAGFLTKRAEKLRNPKRFLLRACRWKALRALRSHKTSGHTFGAMESHEILVALYDEDRERFFRPVSRQDRQALSSHSDTQEPLELSATVEVPGSVVRVSFSLTKPLQKAS